VEARGGQDSKAEEPPGREGPERKRLEQEGEASEKRAGRPGRDRPLPKEVERLVGAASPEGTEEPGADAEKEDRGGEDAYRRYLDDKYA
jgi:hypothetical protein